MTLCDMNENDICTIKKLNCAQAAKRRLMELGIFEGQKVKCKYIGINKSPIVYEISSGKLAIRKKDAAMIEVKR